MEPITDELIRDIASKMKDQPAEFPPVNGPRMIDEGPSKELEAFLSSGEENIRRKVKEVI